MATGDVKGPTGCGFTETSSLGTLELNQEAPTLVFKESDATLPAGLWRLAATGSELILELNTASAGDFTTVTTVLTASSAGVVTLTSPTITDPNVSDTLDLRQTSSTLPDGLWRLEAVGNELVIKQNTATAGDFSTLIPALAINLEGAVLHHSHEFRTNPVTAAIAGGAATGATGDENVMIFHDQTFEYHILGTQTILAPSLTSAGLNVALDQVDNDGVEIGLGITSRSPAAFTVGTDAAFFAELKFSIATVAGTDDCAFGFRKAEDYNANIDDNDEMACLNVILGDIKIETILNNSATTTTDTTDDWADTETHTLRVNVSAAGVVTYLIDGVAPTTTAAFTFDTAEVVVPFFYMLQATASQTGVVALKNIKCGPQA